jgi:predicted nucleotidyltransferase component of viral defense system
MSRSSVADSVRDRLLNRKRETGENYEALLTRYALERLLYRLGQSDLREQFVLKGAYVFLIWQGDLHRPTRDLDLLGYGKPERLEQIFRRLCQEEAGPEDGVRFDPDSVEVQPIRDADEYGGTRVRLDAALGSAELRLQADVGFGDVVVPEPEDTSFPSLLDFPSPNVRTYSRPTVVAEKLHGLATLGIANSRMKDFYDLWYLSREFSFEGPTLTEAIRATFDRRETALPPSEPQALTDTFADDEQKQRQWSAFLNRTQLETEDPDLGAVIGQLNRFLWPPLNACREGRVLHHCWPPGGSWTDESSA